MRLHAIRRLYETDALGIVDDEQINAVGYALLARCESIVAVTEAHDAGRLSCPRCRAPVQVMLRIYSPRPAVLRGQLDLPPVTKTR